MMGRLLPVCSLVLLLALPGSASAGDLRLAIQNGRVALSARDVTLRQILLEWERVGGMRIMEPDRIPDTLLTLELVDVPEGQALETLLRSTAGYAAARRIGSASGASQFSRIYIMPGAARPVVASMTTEGARPSVTVPYAGPGPSPLERRIMPDGRVVVVQQNQGRPDDLSVTNDEQDAQAAPGDSPVMMFPPGQLPQRLPQGQGPTGAFPPNPSGIQGSGSQMTPASRTAPTAVKSTPRPGMVIPEPPVPYTPPQYPPKTPPPPIKPPGI